MNFDNILSEDKTNVLQKLLGLADSTTLFLESLKGERLKVSVVSQEEFVQSQDILIERIVKLYFESVDCPLLYCVSYLKKSELTNCEYHGLVKEVTPIGVIFNRCNNPKLVTKNNISISEHINAAVAAMLNVRSEKVFQKKYDYSIGNRCVGYICEFFSPESLSRL